MPVDLEHPRFGPQHGLGRLTVWDCVACGLKNEGRTPEQGCVHCGAGDPAKSQPGSASSVPSLSAPVDPSPARTPQKADRDAGHAAASVVPAMRILRLIEYLILPGRDSDVLLRPSLVGRVELAWGTITATIVDSCDMRQEDLLGMARRQPGVWLANPDAMRPQQPQQVAGFESRRALVDRPRTPLVVGKVGSLPSSTDIARKEREMPDTGPTWTREEGAFAHMLAVGQDFRLVNTLALALSSIAPELEGNSEPEKFLSAQECLRLANALLHQIPDDWRGDGVEDDAAPPPAAVAADPRAQDVVDRIDRIRAGSVPTALPWQDPTDKKDVL